MNIFNRETIRTRVTKLDEYMFHYCAQIEKLLKFSHAYFCAHKYIKQISNFNIF